MRVYGIWCNKQKAWYTNGKNFVVTGVPKTWTVSKNAQQCINRLNYWGRQLNSTFFYDLRLVAMDLTPVDNEHLV